jgi:hypothetical protein
MKGAYTLADEREPMVRLYCPDCHRCAQFRRAGLIERFGAEHDMPSLLAKLQPCDRPNDMRSRCRLVYFDRLQPERQAEALARGGLPATWQVDRTSPRD